MSELPESAATHNLYRQSDVENGIRKAYGTGREDGIKAERKRIAAAVRALPGYRMTIERESGVEVEGDWGRRRFEMPPATVTVTVDGGDKGSVERSAVLRIVEATDG